MNNVLTTEERQFMKDFLSLRAPDVNFVADPIFDTVNRKVVDYAERLWVEIPEVDAVTVYADPFVQDVIIWMSVV